ncbi:hypothetical protein BsWGS_13784 [Bradybaena similaris]
MCGWLVITDNVTRASTEMPYSLRCRAAEKSAMCTNLGLRWLDIQSSTPGSGGSFFWFFLSHFHVTPPSTQSFPCHTPFNSVISMSHPLQLSHFHVTPTSTQSLPCHTNFNISFHCSCEHPVSKP